MFVVWDSLDLEKGPDEVPGKAVSVFFRFFFLFFFLSILVHWQVGVSKHG